MGESWVHNRVGYSNLPLCTITITPPLPVLEPFYPYWPTISIFHPYSPFLHIHNRLCGLPFFKTVTYSYLSNLCYSVTSIYLWPSHPVLNHKPHLYILVGIFFMYNQWWNLFLSISLFLSLFVLHLVTNHHTLNNYTNKNEWKKCNKRGTKLRGVN